jgi:hypothetical protein
MSRINKGRVLLGGLVAGLVLNLGEFILNEVLFVKEMEEIMRRLNTPRPGVTFIVVAVVMTFVLGIVIVLVYAMIRSRFGPGPKTAVLAGIVVWFCVYFYAGLLTSVLFQMPAHLLFIGIPWGFFEYVLASLIGASLYQEV